MIRRKTVCSQDTKLKPPKDENLIVEGKCPPRSNTISGTDVPVTEGRQPHVSKKHKDSKVEKHDARRSSLCAVLSKSNANQTNDRNGTNLALKAIGESLVKPLELNIQSSTEGGNEHKPVCLTQSESFKGSKSKIFSRWQYKKLLSASQVNVSNIQTPTLDDKIAKTDDIPVQASHDVDIIAFQRELINLPTFVMDTPIDISPVFSRSSSVPENLAGRLNPTSGSFCQLSMHSSGIRLSKNGCGSEQAVSTLVHTGSSVAITMTDVDHHDSVFFFPSDDLIADTPDENVANIIVHFDPPQSPLLSSASSQSPKDFDFPSPPAFNSNTNNANFLQPTTKSNTLNASTSVQVRKPFSIESTLVHTAESAPVISETMAEMSDSKSSLTRPDNLRISPVNSPITEMPIAHQGVLRVIETWISVCQTDLEGTPLVVFEMREFLKKLSVLGQEYKAWCQTVSSALHLEVRQVKHSICTDCLPICLSVSAQIS